MTKAERRDVSAIDAAHAAAKVAAIGTLVGARAVVLCEGVGAAQDVSVA